MNDIKTQFVEKDEEEEALGDICDFDGYLERKEKEKEKEEKKAMEKKKEKQPVQLCLTVLLIEQIYSNSKTTS